MCLYRRLSVPRRIKTINHFTCIFLFLYLIEMKPKEAVSLFFVFGRFIVCDSTLLRCLKPYKLIPEIIGEICLRCGCSLIRCREQSSDYRQHETNKNKSDIL